MIDAILHLALAVMAQDAPGPSLIPPPPPPIKGGTFSCGIFDRENHKISISGEFGNWRLAEAGNQVVDLKVQGPKGSGISFQTTVPMRPLRFDFASYDRFTKTRIDGRLEAVAGGDGFITIQRSVLDRSGARKVYVGFCDMQFSTDPRKISA